MNSSIFSNRILDEITPIQFKDTLLIPIKADIVKLFGTNKIQFQLSIKNNTVVLESPQILADMDIQDKHQEPETTEIG